MARLLLGVLISAIFCAVASAGKVTTALRQGGFVRDTDFKHRLRICNAYPDEQPLEISLGSQQKLTGNAPLAYKQCQDFLTALSPGDKLEFKVGDTTAGTFSVQQLPASDAVMLLVVHRHDALSSAVAFESHVFANLPSAQVAVIDTYKGTAKSVPRIMDAPSAKAGNSSRSEELRFDSVVAVAPGSYEVELSGSDGATKATHSLVALNHESYVVIRAGAEAHDGPSYPQELIVFPQSSPSALQSGAPLATPGMALLALLLAAVSSVNL